MVHSILCFDKDARNKIKIDSAEHLLFEFSTYDGTGANFTCI